MISKDNPYAFIHETATVAPTAVLGQLSNWIASGAWLDDPEAPCVIGAEAWLGHYCLINRGAHIGPGSTMEPMTTIMEGSRLGTNTLLIHRASIGALVTIGDNCVIGGARGFGGHQTLCSRSVVGSNCRMFGSLIHRQLDPPLGTNSQDIELGPQLDDNVFVGNGAKVIGHIRIGTGAYITANTIVTKDVPPGMIVRNTNEHVRPEDWTGDLGRRMIAGMASS